MGGIGPKKCIKCATLTSTVRMFLRIFFFNRVKYIIKVLKWWNMVSITQRHLVLTKISIWVSINLDFRETS